MQTQNKRNSQFMIAKEVFIYHILGQIEEHYELSSKCLGEGGFGKVFEGRRKRNVLPNNSKDPFSESFSSLETSSRCGSDTHTLSQPRAIKRISYKRPQDKQLMQNEMEILSYVDHPLIVKLYQTFEHNKNLFLVIDLLKGGDLFTVINQNTKLHESQAKVVFLQLVKALKYLHTQHICHRDLKLENIMFLNREDFTIQFVDFGLAFCWDDDMRMELKKKGLHNKMTGTPDYMAPEMLNKDYDQRCDVWSAGVILYILLSGQAPFHGNTETQIIQKIKSLDYTFDIPEFDGISDQAKDLVQNILKPENQRISLEEIIVHPWFCKDESKEESEPQTCQTKSIASDRKLQKRRTILRKKLKTSKQLDSHLRKGSLNTAQDPETDLSSKSYCSEDLIHEHCPEQLTVAKLQHYSRLSKLQKFQAIFAVSKLSQTRLRLYGEEFLSIDKDNDGTVSLEDLTKYLQENQGYQETEQIQAYFSEVALSRRGYISYSEYLACVLAYHEDYFNSTAGQVLEFDERFSENGKSSVVSEDDTLSEPIILFDDFALEELFCLLDKNSDGLISKKDFLYLLETNGIENQNKDFLDELTKKLNAVTYTEEKVEKKSSKGPWFIDPRTFKDQLSRTYKGESDGGISAPYERVISVPELTTVMRLSLLENNPTLIGRLSI